MPHLQDWKDAGENPRAELIGPLAITEPGGGSDVVRLRTTAVRDGDRYVVDGAKTLIASGVRADEVLRDRTATLMGYAS